MFLDNVVDVVDETKIRFHIRVKRRIAPREEWAYFHASIEAVHLGRPFITSPL